jgi:hypothetical protein
MHGDESRIGQRSEVGRPEATGERQVPTRIPVTGIDAVNETPRVWF